MASYRLYCLDGGGKIGFADWIEAENDQDALAQARALKSGARRCEIWEAGRMVASFSDQAFTPRPQTSSPELHR
jgi:hypothetical protein